MDVYEKYGSSVISLEAVPEDKIERYGIINGTQEEQNVYKINQLVEKPPLNQAPSNLAIMDRYVLTSDIFDKLKETEVGVGGEIQIINVLSKLDSIYGIVFYGKTYDIENGVEWLNIN